MGVDVEKTRLVRQGWNMAIDHIIDEVKLIQSDPYLSRDLGKLVTFLRKSKQDESIKGDDDGKAAL